MLRRRFIALGAAALAAPSLSRGARAQTYPTRFVRLIVPFPPGGAVDGAARIIAARLSEMWGQQMVIENRPGAGGNVAAQAVLQADADGYTVYIASIGHAISQFVTPSISYHPIADFAPVTLMCVYPNIMAVPNSSPSKSVPEFIARARAEPGKVTYCSSGIGTSLHLAGELFKRMAGIDVTHIPYRGAGQALNDLIPGRVDAIFANFPSTLPYVQNGQLRGLAVTTAKRQPEVPDLPAIAEFVPGYDVSSWFALFVAARTPPELVARLQQDAVAALNHPPVKARYAQLGATTVARPRRSSRHSSRPRSTAGDLSSRQRGSRTGKSMTSSRVVLVTGAAGGIGAAITRALIGAGHIVAAVDRDAAGLTRLGAVSGYIFPLVAELAHEDACRDVVAAAVKRYGRLDAVVNNAGIGVSSLRPDGELNLPRIDELTAEIWDNFFAINVRAPMLLTQAALPHMRKGGFGRVINNTTSFRTMLRVLPYGATKSALESMSAIWAAELKGDGITVNVLIPGGPTDTPFISDGAGWDRGKMLRPAIMGPPACWLISEEAAGYTGNRIIAANWDARLGGAQAAAKAGRAIGWPELGADAVWLKG